MPEVIRRAIIKGNGDKITYYNGRGMNITYSPNGSSNANKYDAVLLFSTINKYFTGKDPNITPAEQLKIRADIAKARAPISGNAHYYARPMLDIYSGVDFVLKIFSDKNSEGGENITPNEVYQMFEIFHSWTCGDVWNK